MDPYSILEENQINSGNISFESINWSDFRELGVKKDMVEFTGYTKQTLRSISAYRLKDLQCVYYMLMRSKNKTSCDSRDFLADLSSSPVRKRDQVVAYESIKRSAENSLEFDRIMKISKAASVAPSEKICMVVLILRNEVILIRTI